MVIITKIYLVEVTLLKEVEHEPEGRFKFLCQKTSHLTSDCLLWNGWRLPPGWWEGSEIIKHSSQSLVHFLPEVCQAGKAVRESARVSPNQPTGSGAHSLLHRTSRPGFCRMREALGWSSLWSLVCWQLGWRTLLALCYLVGRRWTGEIRPAPCPTDRHFAQTGGSWETGEDTGIGEGGDEGQQIPTCSPSPAHVLRTGGLSSASLSREVMAHQPLLSSHQLPHPHPNFSDLLARE